MTESIFKKGLLKYLSGKDLKKIESVKIGIAGAGGLGSNCARNLVRCGFNDFIIIDFDRVEESNLNRQFYFTDQIGMFKTEALKENLKRINPYVKIETFCKKLGQGDFVEHFKKCRIIVEAFDNVESKKKILDEISQTDIFIVGASGLAGYGNTENLKIRKAGKNMCIIGDFITGVTEKNPPLSPGVTAAASMQADTVLKYVLDDMPLKGKGS